MAKTILAALAVLLLLATPALAEDADGLEEIQPLDHDDTEDDHEDSPGLGIVLTGVALLGVVALRRRA